MTVIGYVVLEFNQAGGPATLPGIAEVHGTKIEAVEDRDAWRTEAARVGRRDRYAVAAIDLEDEEDNEN